MKRDNCAPRGDRDHLLSLAQERDRIRSNEPSEIQAKPLFAGFGVQRNDMALVASAKDVNAKIGTLLADSKAWKATVSDCFGAMIIMTPTLSDYFEDWKESRFSDDKSGKFQAVSRISDMRGIMSSCDVMYKAVKGDLAEKDKALAKSINLGFNDILNFLDLLDKREKAGKITASEIDELAEQAKEKTDKLVPQIEQGSALLGFNKAG